MTRKRISTILSPKPSEIWLVRFPFSDLTSAKVRPALIVATHRQDVIILGIFSKIPGGTLPETWILVGDSHSQFSAKLGWLLDRTNRQVKRYRPNQPVEVLSSPVSLSDCLRQPCIDLIWDAVE